LDETPRTIASREEAQADISKWNQRGWRVHQSTLKMELVSGAIVGEVEAVLDVGNRVWTWL
jgi:hypothetical protein